MTVVRLAMSVIATATMMRAAIATPHPAAAAWQMGTPIVTQWLLGYEDGGVFDDADAQYAINGGYNLVWVTSPAELDVAARYGLRAMYLNMGVITPIALDDPAGRAALDALICRVSAYPAFYSYYVADEPSDSQFDGYGRLVSYLREHDPDHLGYVNVFPVAAFGSASIYQAYLDEYMATVCPSLLSYDNYEFMSPTTGRYFQNLAMIRQTAGQAGVPFMNIVPACAVGGSPTPTSNQLRFLVNTTLAYGGQGIHYWVGSGMSTETYQQLTPLNHQFVAVASQVQSLYTIGAYHLGDQPPGTTRLPANSPFNLTPTVPDTAFVDGQPVRGFVLGLFGPGASLTDATYAYVANLDYANGAVATVTGPGFLSVFDANTGTWMPTGHDYARLDLLPGGGVLVGLTSVVPAPSTTEMILRPIGATASSTLVLWAMFSPLNTISNQGWYTSFKQVVCTLNTYDPVPESWPTFGPDMEGSWYSDNETFDAGKWIAFDLGDTFRVTGFHIWPQGPNGIKDIVVQYLVNGNWVDAQGLTIPYAEPSWTFEGYDCALARPITVRQVRLLITSNWVADPTAEIARRVTIGKIRFTGTPVSAIVRGTAVLHGFEGDNTTVGLKFQLTPVAGGGTLTRQVFLQADGSFSLSDIPPAVYTIIVKGDSWLSVRLDKVTVAGGLCSLGTIDLKDWDSNGDNQVTFEDFSMLQNVYGSRGASAADLPALSTLDTGVGGCGPVTIWAAAGLVLAVVGLRQQEGD